MRANKSKQIAMKIAYYSHNRRKYNTKEESEEMSFIENHFEGVALCANKDIGELGSIQKYLEAILDVHQVYVAECEGCVEKGVYEECAHAIENGIPVLLIRKGENGYFCVPVKGVALLDDSIRSWSHYGRIIVDTALMAEYLKALGG